VTAVDHESVMRQAIAVSTRFRPHPNPRVGAVLVSSDGTVVAEHGHAGPGEVHAERGLLEAVGPVDKDHFLVVTLEPCVHTGRTPPCVEAIIDAGVSRVVVGAIDPDSRVAGNGVAALRAAGIEVVTGVAAGEVEESDPGYFHHRRTGMPLVTLKSAATLDGQIAAADGTSQWITGEPARTDAHRLRAEHDAVLVGAGTVRSDDPLLNVRLADYSGPQPVPVIVAGSRPLPGGLRIWERSPVVLGSEELVLTDVDFVRCGTGGVVDLRQGLAALADRGLLSILVEGGSRLAASLWSLGLVERGVQYLGANLAGGTGRGMFDRLWGTLDDMTPITITGLTRLGEDLRVDWRRV
jgi:diaminohydroxyphosphoribosylaminopyrimidine deaminase / 5-amino-6-(5-phosphoribosylamino)uracil reductase